VRNEEKCLRGGEYRLAIRKGVRFRQTRCRHPANAQQNKASVGGRVAAHGSKWGEASVRVWYLVVVLAAAAGQVEEAGDAPLEAGKGLLVAGGALQPLRGRDAFLVAQLGGARAGRPRHSVAEGDPAGRGGRAAAFLGDG
jgi:hypothetical protein